MALWLRRHPGWVDALAGVAVALVLTAATALALSDEGFDAVALPCCAVAGSSLAVRRSLPVVTVAVVSIAIGVYGVTDQPAGPIYAMPFVAAFNLACYRGIRTWLPWTALLAAALVGGAWVGRGVGVDLVPVGLLLLATPKLADDSIRARRLRMEALEAQLRVAEHETMRRVAEERLHIAREVHDVVGHGLATISLRAGVADRVADRDPAEVRAALRAIRRISRDALAELTGLLGILRDAGDGTARAPTAGFDALPGLVDGVRRAGLDVEVEIAPLADGAVPDIVGAAGYRIVQEALTNVARHAGAGARAHVRIARHDDVVEIEVRDDGRTAPAAVRPGGGLTGMRERATALGGSFEAGRAADGGFRVRATLPVVAR